MHRSIKPNTLKPARKIIQKTHSIFFLVCIFFVNPLKRLLFTNLENRAETLRYKICGGNDHVVCCLHHHWDLSTRINRVKKIK
jgi:hypothetical protein